MSAGGVAGGVAGGAAGGAVRMKLTKTSAKIFASKVFNVI